MNNKLTINKQIKTISVLVAILFIVSIIVLVISLKTPSVSSGTGSPSNFVSGLFLLFLLEIVCILTIPFSLKKIYNRAHLDDLEKGKFIEESMKNLENQNKSISNLTNLYNNLVEYDRQKTEFFSNIIHELKTPIAIMLGAMQLIEQSGILDQTELVPKHLKHIQTIKQNCYRILRLVNNILDITRLDSGYIKLNMVNSNIAYFIEEITQSVVPYAQQKNITVVFDTDKEELVTAIDADKIERIILNLLSNAIKFTPYGGKIEVTLASNNNKVIISVKDSGPGIPKNMQNTIFERFRQLDNSLIKANEGSGIGLSIVKSFVELHDGSIKIESEESKGSKFIVELPLRLCKSTCGDSPGRPLQSRIIESLNIEFSDIYDSAS